MLVAAASYRENNRDALRRKRAKYRADHPGSDAAYYEANKDKVKAKVAEYQAANSARIAEARAVRRRADLAYRLAGNRRLRAWKKRNKDKVNADTAKRQLRLRQAAVPGANDFFIKEAYHLARLRTELFGEPLEVDHIVPLNSDLVCGLHCEANLQVILADDNLAKSNRWWPNMPE